MIYDYLLQSSVDEEWFEGLESDDGELDMGDAVKIQDPISSLMLEPPITVELGTSMKNTLKIMQRDKKNCVLITDSDKLIGILTERDILLKITGKGFDLDLVSIDEFMTRNPETLSPEDPLAYALNKMYIGGFRHVPIISDLIKYKVASKKPNIDITGIITVSIKIDFVKIVPKNPNLLLVDS